MRYLLFGGEEFYPQGGWQDYKAGFDSLSLALGMAAANTFDPGPMTGTWEWWHIVDLETGKIVEEGVTVARRRRPDEEHW